jgi:hypothetical protein
LERIPEYAAAGVTVLSLNTHEYCTRVDEIEGLLKAAVAAALK